MKTISKWTTALVLLSGAAYAQLPSTNDTSDGFGNTGMGTDALFSLTPSADYGAYNTATGYDALYFNTTGSHNAAFGTAALAESTTGGSNTAIGDGALYRNKTGSDNTATGMDALLGNSTGNFNTATGFWALHANTTGSNNTASGSAALRDNTTGSRNIALGTSAGFNVTTGNNNIEIGNEGTSTDNNMIKIGTEGTQAETFIAGIYDNTSVSGLTVIIDSDGQLGTVKSSERYKTAIAPMGANTSKLQQLRPVTFRYKTDNQGTLRYGLIAEEVAKVYPELVVRDSQGRIDGVRYDELAPMLLNEMHKQQQKIAAQDQHAAVQDAKISQLQEQLTEMHATLLKLESKDQLVAQR